MQTRGWIAVILGLLVFANQAGAQDAYPSKPIRLVVPFTVGGATDIAARIMAQRLSELLPQRVIVDNRPGAGAVIGTDIVAKSPPDGYTLLLGEASSLSVNPWLYKNIPYDALKDFTAIGQVANFGFLLAVYKDLPVKDLAGFIALVKANPGKYNYGSPGNGTMPQLCAEVLKSMAGGLQITHVSYRGAGPVMNDLSAGQIAMSFPTPVNALPQLQAGNIRALGASSLQRDPAAPDVPTLDEQGLKGFECYNFFGIFGPARLPAAVVTRLNAAINTALDDPAVVQRLRDVGLRATPGTTPEIVDGVMRSAHAKWGPVIHSLNLQMD